MAARTPRRSFAAPFVVTLAAVPACYVQTTSGPGSPPPSPPPSESQSPPQQPPERGPVVSNPPRPQQPPPAQQPPQQGPVVVNPPRPQQPPPTTTPPVTTPHGDMAWTIFKGNDGCMAAIKSECPPKATCNPPPPFKTACPEDVSLPATIVSQDGGSTCMVEFKMPECPKGVACNPPRPRRFACPTRQ